MKSRDFAYWLQGFFEISEAKNLDEDQTEMVKRHLNLVFKHEIDPSMGDKKHQQELNIIHQGSKFQEEELSSVSIGDKIHRPRTEEEAIAKWGAKPSPEHEFNMHGWYNPNEGTPRC